MAIIGYLLGSILAWCFYHLVRLRIAAPISWPRSIAAATGRGVLSLFWFYLLTECVHWGWRSTTFVVLYYTFLVAWVVYPVSVGIYRLTRQDGFGKFLRVPAAMEHRPTPKKQAAQFMHCEKCGAVLFGKETRCPQCGRTLDQESLASAMREHSSEPTT